LDIAGHVFACWHCHCTWSGAQRFFFPRQRTFNASWMHDEVQLLEQLLGQRSRVQTRVLGLTLLDEGHDLIGEFVCSLGPALPRQEPGNPPSVKALSAW